MINNLETMDLDIGEEEIMNTQFICRDMMELIKAERKSRIHRQRLSKQKEYHGMKQRQRNRKADELDERTASMTLED